MLCALIVSAVITGIITAVHNILVAPFKREKELQKAIDAGHVTKAKFVDIRGSHDVEDPSYLNVYEYEVNGKKYKKYKSSQLYDTYSMGKEFDWYYRKYPSKAREGDKIAYYEYEWIRIFIVTFLVVIGPCILLTR